MRDPRLWQALYINYLSNNEVPLTSLTSELPQAILTQLKVNLVENKKERATMVKKIEHLAFGSKYTTEITLEESYK